MKLKWIYIIVILVSFLAYANTLSHGFVWDDQIVITLNSVTNQGLDNLKEIWTSRNYIQDRPTYRPIPQTYFATLWAFFPDNPFPFHLGTVLLYAFSCFSFLVVLKQFFPLLNNYLLLFIGLYFALMPVHSEVVANSKSSDEIMSAIFVLWSLYFAKKQTLKHTFIVVLLFILALLSKVSAITILPIIIVVLVYKNNALFKQTNYLKYQLVKAEKALTVLAFLNLIALAFYFNKAYAVFGVPLVFLLAWYALSELKSYFKAFVLILLIATLYFFSGSYLPAIFFFYILISQNKSSLTIKNIPLVFVILVSAFFVVLSKTFLLILVLLSAYTFWEFNKKDKLTLKALFASIGIPLLIIIAATFFTQKSIELTIPFIVAIPFCLLVLKQFSPKVLFPFIFAVAIAFDFYSNGVSHKNGLSYVFDTPEATTSENNSLSTNDTAEKRIFENEPYHNILVAAPNTAVKMATIFRIQLIYLQKSIFPIHLVHQHGTWQISFASWKDWDVYLSILVHLALLYLLFKFYQKKRWLLFWSLLWFVLSMSIYTNIIRLMPDTLAERFLFLPSFGFSVFFVLLLNEFLVQITKNTKTQKYVLAAVFLPLFIYNAFKIVDRNKAWGNNYTLSAKTLPFAQNNATINAQYAVELRNLVKYNLVENKDSTNALAIKHYNKSIELFPSFYGPYSDLAIYYILDAKPNEAFPYLVKATELKPDEWIHQYYLGLIYYERKKYNEAIERFEAIIVNKKINKNAAENPELKDSYEYAARCYYNLGKVDKAAEKLEEAMSRFNHSSSFILLANIYRKSGKRDEAINVYERLLTQEPENQELKNTIDYLKQGLIY